MVSSPLLLPLLLLWLLLLRLLLLRLIRLLLGLLLLLILIGRLLFRPRLWSWLRRRLPCRRRRRLLLLDGLRRRSNGRSHLGGRLRHPRRLPRRASSGRSRRRLPLCGSSLWRQRRFVGSRRRRAAGPLKLALPRINGVVGARSQPHHARRDQNQQFLILILVVLVARE